MSESLTRPRVALLLALLAGGCQFDRSPVVPIYHGQISVPRAGAQAAPTAGASAAVGGAAGPGKP